MTEEQMKEIAQRNIECHLADCIDEDSSSNDVYEEVYTLALDALLDAHVEESIAGPIAVELAKDYAMLGES